MTTTTKEGVWSELSFVFIGLIAVAFLIFSMTNSDIAPYDPSISEQVKQGLVYSASYENMSVAQGSAVTFLIRTGNKQVMLGDYLIATDGGDDRIRIFESPTVTNTGTALTLYNRDRAQADSPSFDVFSLPTVSSNGVLLQSRFLESGYRTFSTINKEDAEFYLKANTDYLISIENLGSGQEVFYTNLIFIE